MGFSLSALQFGKELLEVKSEAKEKVLLKCWSFPHQEAFEFTIALEHAESHFFRGGYFATASMIYPRASCRVVLK